MNSTDHQPHATTPDDLAPLRRAHPEGWSFRITAEGGRPLIVAVHDDGGMVSARTPEALDAKLTNLTGGQL